MTTSRSEVGPIARRRAPGSRGSAAALALSLLAGPSLAQEVALPSGLSATLFDVVLEAAGAAMAPDAFTDPEALEDGAAEEDTPLDEPPGDTPPAVSGDPAAAGLARFRLVVPGLGGEGAGYDVVAGDFLWLCKEVALPALAANAWTPSEVVVALSDRETDFGVTDPDAVQFFEGFRIADGTCVPQAF